MLTPRNAVVAVLVGASLWFGWHRLFPSDEAQIAAVLDRVADGVAGGGGVEAVARIAALQEEFAVDATIDAGPPFERLSGRQAIIGTAARLRVVAPNLDLSFPEASIVVDPGGQSALATVVAEARFDERSGGRGLAARELEMRFTRQDGRWMIQAVTLVAPIERLDTR